MRARTAIVTLGRAAAVFPCVWRPGGPLPVWLQNRVLKSIRVSYQISKTFLRHKTVYWPVPLKILVMLRPARQTNPVVYVTTHRSKPFQHSTNSPFGRRLGQPAGVNSFHCRRIHDHRTTVKVNVASYVRTTVLYLHPVIGQCIDRPPERAEPHRWRCKTHADNKLTIPVTTRFVSTNGLTIADGNLLTKSARYAPILRYILLPLCHCRR